jgi:REP-associated tyrosine transposase
MAVGKPQRRNRETPRLPDYDYTEPGAYFVTVCAYRRWSIFGQIVEGKMRLNGLGKLVDNMWRETPRDFSVVDLDAWVVMPNHFHAVVTLKDPATEAAWRARGERVPVRERFGRPVEASLPTIMRSFKTAVRREAACRLHIAQPVWQPRYFEHVVRNEEDLERIRDYIEANPSCWETDHENPNRKA